MKIGREVGILADLPGPKIRVETFAAGGAARRPGGNRFDLVACLDAKPGDETQVGVSYLELTRRREAGRIAVARRRHPCSCRSTRCRRYASSPLCSIDYILSNRKGPNKTGRRPVATGAITDRPRAHRDAAGMEVDFIVVSFCRNAEDMHEGVARVARHGSNAALVSKIERAEGDRPGRDRRRQRSVMAKRGDPALRSATPNWVRPAEEDHPAKRWRAKVVINDADAAVDGGQPLIPTRPRCWTWPMR